MRFLKFIFLPIFLITVFSFYSFFLKRHEVNVKFRIYEGKTVDDVVSILKKENVLTSPTFSKLFSRVKNLKVKTGCYELEGNLTDREILSILEKGSYCPVTFTIIEGSTVFDVADVLSEKGLCNKKEFLSLAFNGSFSKSLGLNGTSLEGYLFPDTYEIDKDSLCKVVVSEIIKNFKKKVYPLYKNYSPPLEVKKALKDVTLSKILNVASIVEKETSVSTEKSLVAGIVYSRLIRKMPVQCDPTVIYAYKLKGKDIKVLKGSDIRKIDSSYNSYYHRGLPPTPICNPGLESIKAALYPSDTNYLYFFAVGDRHVFSRTYKEHVNKMKKYYNIRK